MARAGDVFLDQDDGVDRGVQPLDRGKRRIQQFGRRDLAPRHQMGKFGCVGTAYPSIIGVPFVPGAWSRGRWGESVQFRRLMVGKCLHRCMWS